MYLQVNLLLPSGTIFYNIAPPSPTNLISFPEIMIIMSFYPTE
jgi:hypothetical protein